MREPIKFPFSHPVINRIVKAAYPGARTRRDVKVVCRDSYRVHDFWDGGSRDYAAFVRLSDMSALPSESIPREERQGFSNPYNLPIADVSIQAGFCVVEHVIFCGRDLGYHIYINADGIKAYLPEASNLLLTA